MTDYVDPTEQLVVELYVRNPQEAAKFYVSFGFRIERDDGDFIELKWNDSRLFLAQAQAASETMAPVGNVRIMVTNVDDYWALAQRLGAKVLVPVADRYYGLRDFTIATPDGLALRFAQTLPNRSG
jgi:catechol 2,3-dioxygenase-like lactoylglutathione lyase family enzyme